MAAVPVAAVPPLVAAPVAAAHLLVAAPVAATSATAPSVAPAP